MSKIRQGLQLVLLVARKVLRFAWSRERLEFEAESRLLCRLDTSEEDTFNPGRVHR